MQESPPGAGSRRHFVKTGGVFLGAAALLGPVRALAASGGVAIAAVTPTEDLMQEHGVLRRLLLIFDELGRRLKSSREFPLEVLSNAVDLNRRFVEDYHEKDEEEYLFTRFDKAGKMVDLVQVLYRQHRAGRKVTARLRELISPALFRPGPARTRAVALMQAYTRMYRPHAAREDTVLYPAFRSVISPRKFLALGETFEDKEEKLFGQNGFAHIVAQVAELEKPLGIYDLARFTPQA
jgi:hemerythrin-like domain-containing protein